MHEKWNHSVWQDALTQATIFPSSLLPHQQYVLVAWFVVTGFVTARFKPVSSPGSRTAIKIYWVLASWCLTRVLDLDEKFVRDACHMESSKWSHNTPCCTQPAVPACFGNDIHGHHVSEILHPHLAGDIISIWDLLWVLISMFEWAFDLNQTFFHNSHS